MTKLRECNIGHREAEGGHARKYGSSPTGSNYVRRGRLNAPGECMSIYWVSAGWARKLWNALLCLWWIRHKSVEGRTWRAVDQGGMLPGVLLVYARGGVPPSYAIPKVAAIAETHMLVITALPPSAVPVAVNYCSSVTDVSGQRLRAHELLDKIVQVARALAVDAILTLAEFALVSVAQACQLLGMPGPGPHAARARNKRLMRQIWAREGVPVPKWRPVDSVDDIYRAWDQLAPPLLLKAGWSAAAVGQILVSSKEEIPNAWNYTRSAIDLGVQIGFSELHANGGADFLVDEIIASTTRSWYRDPRYGDHLSVEGLVVNGIYCPVCITAKAPTSAPFTERANFTPCVLNEELQRLIEFTARRAVDALELETCGTHTEIKLMADNQMCLLETAARFGGVLLVREVETVYGIDMVGALTAAALGERPSLPQQMLTHSSAQAAGSVAMYAIDALGEPWSSTPIFEPGRIDWSTLVSADTSVEIFPDLTMPTGGPMPPYDIANGYLNSAGVLFLTARSPTELITDSYSIMNGLEAAMTRQSNLEETR